MRCTQYCLWPRDKDCHLLCKSRDQSTVTCIYISLNTRTRSLLPGNAKRWKTATLCGPAHDGGLDYMSFQAHLKTRFAKWIIKFLCLGTHKVSCQLVWNTFLKLTHAQILVVSFPRDCQVVPLIQY